MVNLRRLQYFYSVGEAGSYYYDGVEEYEKYSEYSQYNLYQGRGLKMQVTLKVTGYI